MIKPPSNYKQNDLKKDGLQVVFFVRRAILNKEPIKTLAVVATAFLIVSALTLAIIWQVLAIITKKLTA